jgi:hypothetical protein
MAMSATFWSAALLRRFGQGASQNCEFKRVLF